MIFGPLTFSRTHCWSHFFDDLRFSWLWDWINQRSWTRFLIVSLQRILLNFPEFTLKSNLYPLLFEHLPSLKFDQIDLQSSTLSCIQYAREHREVLDSQRFRKELAESSSTWMRPEGAQDFLRRFAAFPGHQSLFVSPGTCFRPKLRDFAVLFGWFECKGLEGVPCPSVHTRCPSVMQWFLSMNLRNLLIHFHSLNGSTLQAIEMMQEDHDASRCAVGRRCARFPMEGLWNFATLPVSV